VFARSHGTTALSLQAPPESPDPDPAAPGSPAIAAREHSRTPHPTTPQTAAPHPAAPQAAGFTYRETVIIIAGLMLGMFLAALDQTIVATALPRIAADLHGGEHLSWVISAYLLTATAATPIYGKLSDLYGRKIMLQIAITVFLAASVLCALAGSIGALIAARALQGLGGGGLLAMAHATIADVVSPRERGRYQAYIASMFATASVLGPVLGGVFADHLGWPWVFWINLPIGLGALVMSQLVLRRLTPKRVRHDIDYPGAVLIVATVGCVLMVTTLIGEGTAWDAPLLLSLAGAAALLLAVTVLQQRRAREAILPPRLFANRIFRTASLTTVLTSAVMLGAIVFMPLFLQLVFRLPADTTGLMLIPLTAATVMGAVTSGRLMATTGRYKPFPLIGITLNIAGLVALSFVSRETPLPLVSGAMALCGVGIGLVMPVMLVSVQNAVGTRDLGAASASVSFFRSIGGSIGVALFAAVLMATLNGALRSVIGAEALGPNPALALLHAGAGAQALLPAISGDVSAAILRAFHTVFLTGALIAALAFVNTLFLAEIPLRTTIGDDADEEAEEPAASVPACRCAAE